MKVMPALLESCRVSWQSIPNSIPDPSQRRSQFQAVSRRVAHHFAHRAKVTITNELETLINETVIVVMKPYNVDSVLKYDIRPKHRGDLSHSHGSVLLLSGSIR